MSKEFEIKEIESDHGPSISIRQTEGVAYDFFGGSPVINPIVLTPYEAEQLIKELTEVTKHARNLSKRMIKY